MTSGRGEDQIQTEERMKSTPFERYLHMHQLEALRVSAQIHVRYCVLWRAIKGMPISAEQAHAIRAGVEKLIGIPYTGPLVTGQRHVHGQATAELLLDQLPTQPLKRVIPVTEEGLFPTQVAW